MNETELALRGIYAAPGWAAAIGWLGRGLVIAAVVFFLAASVAGPLGSKVKFAKIQAAAFVAGALSLFGAMGCLAWLFLGDQFEYGYVAAHSSRAPMAAYKVAAIWAGQQGSFLLWACASALFGVISYRSAGVYRSWYLSVFGACLASLSAILAFETPFGLLPGMIADGRVYVPADGVGLVPSLQNYWVVIHPPTIFMGFGSLTVLFAYGASAMIVGDLRTWAGLVRPWSLVSLAILGLGVVMGGLWAYETQGWGGFWAWDPVENVSLVPWLLVAAFVHGLMVQCSKRKWFAANALLAGLPFVLFVYGTFLTRSGYLDKFSVHSFAQMDRTALWILFGFLVAVTAGFTGLWLFRGPRVARELASGVIEPGMNRESFFLAGTILLTGLALTITIGMSVPFFSGLLGRDAKVVEEPLYHSVTVWFFAPIMVLMAVGPLLSWHRSTVRSLLAKLWIVAGTAILVECATILVLRFSDWGNVADPSARIQFPLGVTVPRIPWVLLLFFLSALSIAANGTRLVTLFKRSKLGVGGFLAHVGVAVTLGGLVLSRGLEQRQQILVMEGTPAEALGYRIDFDRMTSDPARDNRNKAVFSVAPQEGGSDFKAMPAYYMTPGEDGQPTAFTSPYIDHQWSHDLYVALETPQTNLWDEPERFGPGETKQGTGVSITFEGLEMHGSPGQPGTRIGAKLRVVEDGRTYRSEPDMGMNGKGDSPEASPSLRARLTGIDASDGSILLQMPYVHTLFPIELYYKPMTILVWLGTGLMTLGGMLAALARARSRAVPAD